MTRIKNTLSSSHRHDQLTNTIELYIADLSTAQFETLLF